MTKGSIASISSYYKVVGAAVADQQHQGDTNYNRYTATLMNKQKGSWLDMSLATTKNNDNVTVTWYVTNDPAVAQKYATVTAIDSTNGLTLADSKSVQTNLFQYAGSKDEIGGKYVVAVVSAPDYVGKLAITATNTNGTPFEFANTTAN